MRRDPPELHRLMGSWFSSPSLLSHAFSQALPTPHVVIDHFFSEPFARSLAHDFPSSSDEGWHVYDNPLERKRASSRIAAFPPTLRQAVLALCCPRIVEAMRVVTGLSKEEGLQADRYCHGGGLHSHSRGGKLDLHLDYSRHPISGLERRYNLIVYLTEEWRTEYGGALELCERTPSLSTHDLSSLN